MSIELTLLGNRAYIEMPNSLIEWLGWLFLLGITAVWLWNEISYQRRLRQESILEARRAGYHWGLFAALLLLVPLTGLLLVLRLPVGNALPLPGTPIEPIGPAIVLFAMLPVILAAGMLGALEAAFIGLAAGLVQALWETHTFFTPLEFALLGLALSSALRQPYRTPIFRLLRLPLVAAALFSLAYPIIALYSDSFIAGHTQQAGSLASRLDYALTHISLIWPAMAGQLLVSGVFAQVIAWMFPAIWGSHERSQPSPVERRLHLRFLYSIAPLGATLLITLMGSAWVSAGASARDMVESQMASTAGIAAETIPFYIETGQNLIQQIATDPRWLTSTTVDQYAGLEEHLRMTPFFKQLFVLDVRQETAAGYPDTDYNRSSPSPEEMIGVQLALKGVPIQHYTLPPVIPGENAQISFIAAIKDADTNQVHGVLIGRSDLVINPLVQPAFTGLRYFSESGGQGMLLDGNGSILYHTDLTDLSERYTTEELASTVGLEPVFYEDRGPDGTRRLVYFHPVEGANWSVVLTMPARQSQQIALTIAAPMLMMILLLFVLSVMVLRVGLQRVTASLQSLALEANRISSGQLDHALGVSGEDEVGQLRRSFEQMRLSLKARLDELNRLLLVSQGVAASLDLEEAVQPVLESALNIGASAARVVLTPAALPEVQGGTPRPTRFGLGPASDKYSGLDEQVLALAQQQERLVLNNLSRVHGALRGALQFQPGKSRPEALLALALRNEKHYFGVLWLAFDQPHLFTEDEIRFLSTLAGQTELAASNARLFLTAEIGRQRLESILASTPDPVLVTDHQDKLLLANPAAWSVLSLPGDSSVGQPVTKVIAQAELLGLLRASTAEKQSVEVVLSDQRVFLATASSVIASGQSVGRVCVMRDVTHFKQLDALKSEFVSTVSHDLRSPLTLMRGYATMLDMVGELNDQQTSYVRKIVGGVESMSRLVNNLLDLGRIEAGVGLQLEMTALAEVIERVSSSMQLQATQKQIQLGVETQPNLALFVEADPGLLQQAVQNLVENAIKYTDPGGKVNLNVLSNNDFVTFEVKDTGIGVAPFDLPRLFEKFYRSGQRDARKQQGTGLGLAIVKSIAERHGGRVWVESQLGKGSTFTITIPLRQVKPVQTQK